MFIPLNDMVMSVFAFCVTIKGSQPCSMVVGALGGRMRTATLRAALLEVTTVKPFNGRYYSISAP